MDRIPLRPCRSVAPARVLAFVVVTIAVGGGGGVPAVAAATARRSYRLYHVLGEGVPPTPRGRIVIDEATSDPSQSPRGGGGDAGGLAATYHPEVPGFDLDLAAFDRMVDGRALYTLRVVAEVEGGGEGGDGGVVIASAPGCSLRRANLRDEISLSVGPTGALMGVSYRPLVSPLAPESCDNLMSLTERPEAIFRRGGVDGGGDGESGGGGMPFKTTVSFESHRPMMLVPTVLPQTRPPPGLKWYRRNAKNNPSPILGGGGGGKDANGDSSYPFLEDEKPSGIWNSIFVRYWYILVPLAVMGLFGGVDEEPPSPTGPGGSGGATVAAASASGGGSESGGGAQQRSTTKRRGKRD